MKGISMTTLPMDNDNNPIPALRLNPNGAHNIAVTSIAGRNVTPFSDATRILSLYATVPTYIQFGDATTSDHYFPAGVYYDFAIGGDKALHTDHLSVLAAEGNGIIYISEKM